MANATAKYQATIDRCKKILSQYLEFCNEKRTPYVCKLKSTPQGYKEIEDFVIQVVIRGGESVNYAIMEKERQLDPNYIID